MSLENIHLRKLLKILYLPANQRTSALRSDIREEIAREDAEGGGGDFYGPFWRDAKDHAFGLGDLHESVASRITSNPRRQNLYPQLRDGFLLWWNERRRWINEPFEPLAAPKGRYQFLDLGTSVKVDNILAVRDGRGDNYFVYPYFSPTPILPEEGARLGLWLISAALPTLNLQQVRILDVIRGQTFSVDRQPLEGNELETFSSRYRHALNEWRRLWEEYE